MILTSNAVPSDRKGFFTGDDTLHCMLDRIFDKASARPGIPSTRKCRTRCCCRGIATV